MDPNPFQLAPGGTRFSVKATPRARATAVAGFHGDEVRIRLAAPPVEGRANSELIRFLSETLSIPPSRVELVGGAGSAHKHIRVTGLTPSDVRQRLGL